MVLIGFKLSEKCILRVHNFLAAA